MSVLPHLELVRPETVAEALLPLAADPARCVLLGGGTDLLVALKQGLVAPARLIDVTGVAGLADIRVALDGGLHVGAAARLAALTGHPALRDRFTALVEAAASVGSPQLRQMGTLGGNVCLATRCAFYNQSRLWRQRRGTCFKTGGDRCHAVPRSERCHAVLSADTPPALVVLGGRAHVAHLEGTKVVETLLPVADLYGEDGRAILLAAGALVTGISLPAPPAGYRSGYVKYRLRHSIDFPLAGVAAGLSIVDGVVRHARVVLGALAPHVMVAEEAVAVLEGREPAPAALAEASTVVARLARPVANLGTSAGQRRHVIGVLTRRLLTRLVLEAESESAPTAANPALGAA